MKENEKRSTDSIWVTQASRQDFSRAYRKGYWRSIFSWLQNKNNELLPFEEVLKYMPMRGQHYAGFKQIETDKIVGSVSRYLDFDRAFLPRQTHTRARWENIDRAYFQDILLPPIEVYKIGDIYFVKDGNHRVSVARERGQAFMDAYIIEIDTPVEVTAEKSLDQLILDYEHNQFIRNTGIENWPARDTIRFSLPGQYEKILQHISVHRWFMGEKLGREVSDREAVTGWYTDLYKPLVRIISKHQILKEFPSRTETDLYLWILEHRWYLAEELHRRVSLESAAVHFAVNFSTRPFRHLSQFIRWIKLRIKR